MDDLLGAALDPRSHVPSIARLRTALDLGLPVRLGAYLGCVCLFTRLNANASTWEDSLWQGKSALTTSNCHLRASPLPSKDQL